MKSAQCQRSGLPAIRPSVRPGAACALAGCSRRTRAPPPRRIARAPRGGSGRASRARQTARRRSHRLRARSCRRRPLASHLAPRPAACRREARTRSASGEGGRGLRRRTCTLSRGGCRHSTGQRCSAGLAVPAPHDRRVSDRGQHLLPVRGEAGTLAQASPHQLPSSPPLSSSGASSAAAASASLGGSRSPSGSYSKVAPQSSRSPPSPAGTMYFPQISGVSSPARFSRCRFWPRHGRSGKPDSSARSEAREPRQTTTASYGA